MLSHEALQELVQHSGAVVNVASHSTWPFRLPTEVMRWENKLQQVQAELAPHERFLMAWGGDEANNADVAARLSEWELSRAIIRRHSDEFWAYRKSVKEHMTSAPRAMIQQAVIARRTPSYTRMIVGDCVTSARSETSRRMPLRRKWTSIECANSSPLSIRWSARSCIKNWSS